MQLDETRPVPVSKVLVLNGPNLGRLGSRQPEVYGSNTLSEVLADVGALGRKLGMTIEHFQTDDEADLIARLHTTDAQGVILNPGALTHTSRALGDAVRSISSPVVEVHISDVKGREGWRSQSMVEGACVATIYGRGPGGYLDALRHLVNRAAMPFHTERYGPHPLNEGELRGEGDRLVILVHGGVWRHQYRRDTMESLAVDLARRGIRTWNIGYRTLGTGGGWPGSGHDVRMAFDHAGRLADGPIVVVGHSAGGYLAMWAATRTTTPVALVVAMAPVVDLRRAVADGADLSREAAVLLASGAPNVVDPGDIATLVVQGTEDTIVPTAHADELARHPGTIVHRVEAGHFDLLDPSKPHWQVVVERLTKSLG